MERIGLTPGSEVGGYTVVAPLGAGGMGTVYRAVDGGGSPVALKLLHPHVGADPAARERLRREVVALQRLRHPAVAAVLDAEADSTEAFIVTELVDGENLADRVRELGPLEPEELHLLASGLLGALEAVHGAGVVHRDLKPSNVLVTDDGPVLIDFGIAQSADDARVTSAGLVVGTPGYLAPELLEGDEPTPATDLWGWAAVLAFAATGRPPFGSRPIEAVLARASAGDVDLDGVGVRTAAALRGALHPDPAQRTTPDVVVDELARVVDEGDELPDPGTVVLPPGAVPAAAATTVLAQDGRTRLVPTEPSAGAEEDDDIDYRHPTWVEEDVEWIEEEIDASEAMGGDGSGYERPPVPRRWGSLVALALVITALGALVPTWTLLAVTLLLLVFRVIGSTVESMYARRERVGVRSSDHARALATVPWHLLRGSVAMVPSIVVAACALAVAGGALAWLVDSGTLTLGDLGPGDELQGTEASFVAAGAVLLGLVLLWWGPLSGMSRLGTRRVLAAVAPPRTAALVLVCVCVAAAAVLVALTSSGTAIVWAPAPVPTIP